MRRLAVVTLQPLPAGKLYAMRTLTRKCKAALINTHNAHIEIIKNVSLRVCLCTVTCACVYVFVCVLVAVLQVHTMYLFVCVVVGVYVVVKLLMSEVLLLTQLTVEKSLQILC